MHQLIVPSALVSFLLLAFGWLSGTRPARFITRRSREDAADDSHVLYTFALIFLGVGNLAIALEPPSPATWLEFFIKFSPPTVLFICVLVYVGRSPTARAQ